MVGGEEKVPPSRQVIRFSLGEELLSRWHLGLSHGCRRRFPSIISVSSPGWLETLRWVPESTAALGSNVRTALLYWGCLEEFLG